VRTLVLAIILTSGGSLHAGESDKPMTSVERAELEAAAYPYEAWTKTARVGDYIVRKYADGRQIRSEVKSIDSDFVRVDETIEAKGQKIELHRKYNREESSAKTREMGMKSEGVMQQKVNGANLKCEVFDGQLVTARKEWNGEVLAIKLAHYHKIVAVGVPFGGVIRELQATDDKAPLTVKQGMFVRLENTIDVVKVTMEATAWGNTVDEKQK
jgi:hypothetical protein